MKQENMERAPLRSALAASTPSAAQHTPGPWTDHPSVHGSEYRYVQIGADDTYTTLELLPADARLIAASPDLLTALTGAVADAEKALDFMDARRRFDDSPLKPLMHSIRLAAGVVLAKAKGC